MAARTLKGIDIPAPKVTKGFGEKFFETADKFSDRVFQIDAFTEETETWGRVKHKSVRVAIYLKSIGVKPKDVVMLGFPNNMDNATAAFATMLLGAYVASFDPYQDISDIKYALNYIEPTAIIVDEGSLKILEEALSDVDNRPPIIVAGSKNISKLHASMDAICEVSPTFEDEVNFKPFPSDPNDTAFIFFSSGTTGLPKGICLSHKSLLGGSMLPNITPDRTMTQSTSLYWISGGFITAIQLIFGCKKVVGQNVPAKRMLYLIEKYKIPAYFCTSIHVCDLIELGEEAISKYDMSNLRMMVLIGSTFSPTQIRTLRKLFPKTRVFAGYGSTETAGGITTFGNVPIELWDVKIASAGKVCPNVEIKIVDPDTREPLPPNQEGEIVVKTPGGMSGYYKSENLKPYDTDGFLKTGDLGYYDEDDFLYVTDRLNSTFKYQMYKISPVIIETLLKEHPAVQEAVVVGIPHERDRFHPAACVVLKSDNKVLPQELREFVDSQVPEYYKLRGGLKLVEQLPFTPTGKIQRRNVRQLFTNS